MALFAEQFVFVEKQQQQQQLLFAAANNNRLQQTVDLSTLQIDSWKSSSLTVLACFL